MDCNADPLPGILRWLLVSLLFVGSLVVLVAGRALGAALRMRYRRHLLTRGLACLGLSLLSAALLAAGSPWARRKLRLPSVTPDPCGKAVR